MSDLQIGLAVIGAVVICGVAVYNRLQETRFRKRMEASFAGDRGDVLLETVPPMPVERIEPLLKAGPNDTTVPPNRNEQRVEPGGMPQVDAGTFVPDDGASPIDYTIDVASDKPLQRTALQQLLDALSGLGRRTLLVASVADGIWMPLANAANDVTRLRILLQLVDRRGHVTEADLNAFHNLVQQWAQGQHASVNAAEMAPFVTISRELDDFCTEVDVAIGLNVVAASGDPFSGTKLRSAAEAAGFKLDTGLYRMFDAHGNPQFSLETQQGDPLEPERMRTASISGVTLLLDVPRVAQGVKTFDQMVDAGKHLAVGLGGNLVDDNRQPVTEAGLEQIRTQLRRIYAAMDARGIRAGSSIALRLFS